MGPCFRRDDEEISSPRIPRAYRKCVASWKEPTGCALRDASGRRFDAVLVDIDHSPRNLLHSRHAGLYQSFGLARLAGHLTPGGVFALWSNDAPDDAFNSVLSGAFATSVAHVVSFDNPLQHRQASNTVYIGGKA
jgi:hypothetical protein